MSTAAAPSAAVGRIVQAIRGVVGEGSVALHEPRFAGIAEARILAEPEGCRSNYWLQTLLLEEPAAGLRDELLQATNDAGLMTRPV